MSCLTDAQLNFIPHMIANVFPDAAARNTGTDPDLVKKWMRDPDFKKELEHQRKEAAKLIMHNLERHANKAIITLVELLHEDKNDNVRIKAADAILTHTMEFRKLYGIEERIEALEQMADKAKQTKGI